MVGAGVAHRREAGLAIVGRAVHRDHGRCGSNRVTVPVGLHAAPWTRSLFWAPSGGPPAPSPGPVGCCLCGVVKELVVGWEWPVAAVRGGSTAVRPVANAVRA